MPYPVAAAHGAVGQITIPPFAPSDSASLAAWLRAPTTSYITGTTQAADTETLTTWRDSVGAKDFTQATAANRPRLCYLEGTPAIRFGGVNRTQQLTYTGAIVGAQASFTISVAFRVHQKAPAATMALYSERNNASANQLFAIQVLTSGKVNANFKDDANHQVQINSTTLVDDNRIHTATVTLASNTATLYIDGVSEGSSSIATLTSWATSVFNRSCIGATNSTTITQYAQCSIFEIVIYNPIITGATLTSHHSYLTTKYNGVISAYELTGISWGHANYSSARYFNGKTYVGSSDANKSPQLTVITHASHAVVTYKVDDNIGDDYHNSLAVAFDSAGKILAAYDDHNGNAIWLNKSTNAEDASAWGTKIDIGPDDKHAYLQFVTTTEGANSWRVYIFYRNQTHGSYKYRYSDNTHLALASQTWVAAATLWQPLGDVDVQLYGNAYLCADGNIHFVYGSDDTTPQAPLTNDVYHFMYKPSAAKFYKSDGTTEITLPATTANATKIYDSSSNGNRTPTIRYDMATVGSDIYICWSSYDQAGGSGQYIMRSIYSGGVWTNEEINLIPDTGFVSAAFGCNNDGTVDVDTIYFTKTVSGAPSQLHKITRSGGVWTRTTLTSGSHFSGSAGSPHRVRFGVGDVQVVWQWGFGDATAFYGQLMGYPAP